MTYLIKKKMGSAKTINFKGGEKIPLTDTFSYLSSLNHLEISIQSQLNEHFLRCNSQAPALSVIFQHGIFISLYIYN